jgi:hypothetical protein
MVEARRTPLNLEIEESSSVKIALSDPMGACCILTTLARFGSVTLGNGSGKANVRSGDPLGCYLECLGAIPLYGCIRIRGRTEL